MKTTHCPPQETGGCAIWLLIMALMMICIACYPQKIDLHLSDSEKTIISSVFGSGALYSIVKPDCSDQDKIMTGLLAFTAILPHMVDIPDWINTDSVGINFKLRNKSYKCIASPYDKKAVKRYKKRLK
jgi:hypothetical protein